MVFNSWETPVTSEAMNAIGECGIMSGTRLTKTNLEHRLQAFRYQVLAPKAGRQSHVHDLIGNLHGAFV